jgi:arginine 2-monooxygenase
VLQYIENRKALGFVPNGADDMTLETIWVLQE